MNLKRMALLSLAVFSPSAFAQTSADGALPAPTISQRNFMQSIEYAPIELDKALPPKVVILLDSSGSMGQLLDKQKSKMFYAKKLFGSYLADQWREKADVGLLVYGGRRKKDCSDFFMAVPIGEKSLPKIDGAVKKLSPMGMTPIASSLELAINQLKGYPGPKRVMIFTDGEETCGGDSCKILEKAIQEKVIDLEMFVTGIGMKDNSKDLDKLRCLGKTFGAPNPQALQQALNNINNEIKKSSSSHSSGPNLFVQCPNPLADVQVFQMVNGVRTLLKTFKSSLGTSLEPGEYSVDVMLDPIYRFSRVVVPPKRKVTLKVVGTGILTVKFMDSLLEVEVLNRDKKVVNHFLSDEPNVVKSGEYDIHVFGDPFFEYNERKYKINPGANQEIKIEGAGVVQLDYPGTVGIHVYNGSDAHIGNYVTNYPFVLKTGGYRFYVNEKCNIEGVTVRNDKFLQRLTCPKPK